MSDANTTVGHRRLLNLLLGLNLGLATAAAVWLVATRRSEPAAAPPAAPARVEPIQQPPRATGPEPAQVQSKATAAPAQLSATATNLPATQLTAPSSNTASAASSSVQSVTAPLLKARGARPFDWRDVESPDYRRYIENLRAVGCPEDKVRQIVLADINELFDRRRLQIAIESDTAWWRESPSPTLAYTLAQKGRLLEEQRRSLIGYLLGPEALEAEPQGLTPWCHVPLTGAVLGALPAAKHALVQEICGRALERHEALRTSALDPTQPPEPIQAARHREQTRAELRQVLSPEELEEFLLRYSHVAHNLRYELGALNPTEAEFRRVFRAVDPLEHQMQLEFGTVAAMSPEQRDRFQRQRQQAIREALGPERFAEYLLAQDPVYQAMVDQARQRNAPPETLRAIYQLTQATQARRQQILADPNLSPAEREQAIKAIEREQAESLQKILAAGVLSR